METASFKFTMPLKVEVIEEKGEQKVFLEGFLSTNDLDLVNDIVTKNCLESIQRQLIDRNIKLDVEHEAFRGKSFEEREINKTRIPAGRFIDAAVESLGKGRWGLRVKSMLNRYHPRYNEIKGNVMDRMLDGYSIAYIATKARKETVNGKSVRFLDDISLLNAALTGNPINTEALNREIFMKSVDAIQDYNEEKKSNPEIEKMLEVKSQSSSKEQDIMIKNAGGKNMQNDKATETQVEQKDAGVNGGTYGKEGGNAPGKAAEETTSTVSAKADDDKKKDETTTETEVKSAISELKTRVDALEAENKQLKAMPVSKSPGANMGTMKQAEFEQKSAQKKSSGPLDYL